MGKKAEKKLRKEVQELKATMRSNAIQMLHAGFDAAKTTKLNQNHWSEARDHDLTPAVLITSDRRRILGKRCAYEVDNNCYAGGLVSTLAIDMIGYHAPKARILSKNAKLKTFIEEEWKNWSENEMVNLPSKLRVMDEGRRVWGASFPLIYRDDEIEAATGYGFGVNIIPDTRVTDPDSYFSEVTAGQYNDDGVIINTKTGRAVAYKVTPIEDELSYGPMFGGRQQTVLERYMKQWYSPRKPDQYRGFCELTPALPLYSILRRYDMAELTSAEVAAMFSLLLKTPLSPGDTPAKIEDWKQFPLNFGMGMALPEGYEPFQMKAEHPHSVYESFINLILRQIGRCLDVPFGIVAGDSSKYNYSSARLDYRGYESRLSYDRKQLVIRILNWIFAEFLLQLSLMRPDVERAKKNGDIYLTWAFTARPSSDPTKDASAEEMRLANGSTTYSEIYAERGLDWEEELEQRQKEITKLKQLDLLDMVGLGAKKETVPVSDV